MERGYLSEAKGVLQKVRGTKDVDVEFDTIVLANEALKGMENPWRAIFRRRNRPQLILAIAMPFFQSVPPPVLPALNMLCCCNVNCIVPVLFQWCERYLQCCIACIAGLSGQGMHHLLGVCVCVCVRVCVSASLHALPVAITSGHRPLFCPWQTSRVSVLHHADRLEFSAGSGLE